MRTKKVLILSVFLMLGLVLFLSNTVNATSEYIDTASNIKYLLDDDTKTATVIGYVEPGIMDVITIPSKIINGGYEYSVTRIEDFAFLQCNTVKSITIPKTVTSIGKNVFNRCDNLKEINVEDGNTTYSSDDGVLFNYQKTELIRYPEGKNDTTYVVPDVTQISELAFWRNHSLENILLPNTITKIGANAFQFCSSLESIVIPKKVTSIEDFMFDGCTSLTVVIIHDSVTKIGEYAFYGCEGLTNLEIPASVIYVGRNAFYNTILENKIYNIKNSLTNLSSSNIKNFIRVDEDSYKTKLIANKGYKLPQNISIKINRIDLSLNDYEYDFITGDLKIPIDKINGDVEIEAIGNKIHKLSFDANGGKFSEGSNILKYDDAEKFDFDKLEIPARDGYKFIGYYTEKIGGISFDDVMNSEAGIESDTTFYAQWKEIEKIDFIGNIENQEFIVGDDKTLAFTLDTDKTYGKVLVNDVELSQANGDYSWAFLEGSFPYIKLSESYMKTLKVGTHTIKFVLDNGNEAETTFTIVEEKETEKNEPSKELDESPKMGNDNENFAFEFALASICLVTVVSLSVYNKKSRK